ncbi:helix-turn-helix domain-containing protein [Halorarius halobius]|uniref:helix-turn-helix domain-containing protein n=1 Tax=Halorarius halobius TaxID=2962671 RepID=UPI0020CF1185|nr:helix-turn-helix domain-containing protein [Halorarius halobius]
MGLVAEYDVDCAALPLTDVAAAAQSASIRLDLQFNHGERPMFVATVTDGDPPTVEAALSETRDVDGWTLVGEAGEVRRYKATPALSLDEQLGDHLDDLSGLEALAGADAIIERIEVRADGWTQTGWFADRATFHEFRTFWQRNAGFRLHRLTRDGEPEPPGDGLTDRQREALRTAYEMGHFEVPRQASLEAVAAELEVSASALSERLRRAQTHLVEETVATTWPPLPE